jgi:hypothetical protein
MGGYTPASLPKAIFTPARIARLMPSAVLASGLTDRVAGFALGTPWSASLFWLATGTFRCRVGDGCSDAAKSPSA